MAIAIWREARTKPELNSAEAGVIVFKGESELMEKHQRTLGGGHRPSVFAN